MKEKKKLSINIYTKKGLRLSNLIIFELKKYATIFLINRTEANRFSLTQNSKKKETLCHVSIDIFVYFIFADEDKQTLKTKGNTNQRG
jgi:hypothetical protein